MSDLEALRAKIDAVASHKRGCQADDGDKQYDYACPYCCAVKSYAQARADEAAAGARGEHFG